MTAMAGPVSAAPIPAEGSALPTSPVLAMPEWKDSVARALQHDDGSVKKRVWILGGVAAVGAAAAIANAFTSQPSEAGAPDAPEHAAVPRLAEERALQVRGGGCPRQRGNAQRAHVDDWPAALTPQAMTPVLPPPVAIGSTGDDERPAPGPATAGNDGQAGAGAPGRTGAAPSGAGSQLQLQRPAVPDTLMAKLAATGQSPTTLAGMVVAVALVAFMLQAYGVGRGSVAMDTIPWTAMGFMFMVLLQQHKQQAAGLAAAGAPAAEASARGRPSSRMKSERRAAAATTTIGPDTAAAAAAAPSAGTAAPTAPVAAAGPAASADSSSMAATLQACDELHQAEAFEEEAAQLQRAREQPGLTALQTVSVCWRQGRVSNALSWRMAMAAGGPDQENAKAKEARVAVLRQGMECLWAGMDVAEGARDPASALGVQVADQQLRTELACLHKWAAVVLAQVAPSMKEQIANAFKIRDHAKRSLELVPTDPQAMYVLGAWSYEVAQVGWVERRIAAALFGEPPQATLQEALALFQQAEDTEPGFWMVNRLKMAQTYEALGQRGQAVQWLQQALKMRHTCDEDRWGGVERNALAKKLKVHR